MQFPPYHIVLGVTGHRELGNPVAVNSAVQKLLHKLSSILNCTSTPTLAPVYYSIVSSLAKGADRIVARNVIGILQAKLEVIIPMPVDEYRKDFETEDDRTEFDELFNLDSGPTVSLNSLDIDWSDPAQRGQAYLDAGKSVVDACELLIAIWDGQPARGKGGTGDVIEYALQLGRVVLWIDANSPEKEPQLILPGDAGQTLKPLLAVPIPNEVKEISLGFHRYRAFVIDNAVSPVDIEEQSEKFLQDIQKQGIDSGFCSGWAEHGREISVILTQADALAMSYQKSYLFGVKTLHTLAAFAVTVAVFQVLFLPDQLGVILFEILAMLLAACLLMHSRRQAWHEKWLNDRYIAEWLRSAIFTGVFLESSTTQQAAVNPLPFYSGPDQWFTSVFSGVVDRFQRNLPQLEFAARKKFLLQHWIHSQANWHEKTAMKKETIHQQYEWFGIACFTITICMATLHMLGVGHVTHPIAGVHDVSHPGDPHHEDSSNHGRKMDVAGVQSRFADFSLWITFLAIILPAIGAASHAVVSLLEYERIAKRSERMAQVLHELADIAERSISEEEFVSHIIEAKKIIATETQEWLISLSFRGLRLPA